MYGIAGSSWRGRWTVLLVFLALGVVAAVAAEDCEPKRNCDATRDCSLQVDTRDCEPHWGCPDCAWYDALCHVRRLGCEIDKGRYKAQCETEKGAQNAGYVVAKATCETQKAGEKFDCERIKTQLRLGCELGLEGPFSCSADEVLGQVRSETQEGLTDFDELTGAITTPLKKLGGQTSWRDTACAASGIGAPYRNSQRSTDGYCTLDVRLVEFILDGHALPPGDRYIRLEILPGGAGARACADRTISIVDQIRFGGPVKIDKHLGGHRWLEVHVKDDFSFVAPTGTVTVAAGVPDVPKEQASHWHRVVRGESLSRIAEREFGRQVWTRLFAANRSTVRRADLIFPGESLWIPK